jgi:hypothetical protein
MVYFVTTVSLMITLALCVLVGRGGLSSFGWKQWALRVVVAAAVAGLRADSLYPNGSAGDRHSAFFPLPPAACFAHGSAGNCRGDWPPIA